MFSSIEKNYKNLEEIRAALEDGEIEGALIDTYVAADHKSELFSDRIYVKEILDQPLGYGVVLSGAAVSDVYFEINYDEPLNKRISKLKYFLYALHITQSKNTKDFLLHAV